MALLDMFFKPVPDYDADNDPLANPGDDEKTDIGLHVNLCAVRYSDLKQGYIEMQKQLQSMQKMQVALIVFLVATKVIDISLLTGFLK